MTTEPSDDDDTMNCTECGGPVAYGSRHTHCGAVAMKYQNEITRLTAERDRALDRIAAMAAELDAPYAWHHLHHGLRYERGEGEGWWPLYMIEKPEDAA